MMSGRVTLEIEGLDEIGDAAAGEWLRARGEEAVREASRRFGLSGEVRVRVVRDAEMAALHARTMGIDETTDVLTFDLLGGEPAPGGEGGGEDRGIDADIVVCVDEAARQAAQRGHAPERELLLYLVHGVLHCVPGFDDLTEADSARMHATEDEILRAIGVGSVYSG